MIQRVECVGFTARDAETAIRFYAQVLAFQVMSDIEVFGEPWERLTGVFGARMRMVTLAMGNEQIQLTQHLAPPGGRPIPVDSRSNDGWFQHIAIVASDMDAAYARLREHRVQHVSSAPQTLPDYIPAAAGITAFYFRDPDGHNLELIWFPEGKGDPRWQSKHALFLGIDHTAIAISDTRASHAFYRDGLGLTVAGESENYGPEQEHLNMVFGAYLRITGMRAARGIGVEYLQYLSPPGGPPMLADTKANDLWHWETTMFTETLDAVAEPLYRMGCEFISPGIVALPEGSHGPQRALMVRDPDGHAIRIVEATE